MTAYLPQVINLLLGILGGGVLGAWLKYKQLSPKSTAEARQITAAAIDKDWARFEREINRLVKRLEEAESVGERARKGQMECEERELALKARVTMLEAVNDARGEIRQRAAQVVAADRATEAGSREIGT